MHSPLLITNQLHCCHLCHSYLEAIMRFPVAIKVLKQAVFAGVQPLNVTEESPILRAHCEVVAQMAAWKSKAGPLPVPGVCTSTSLHSSSVTCADTFPTYSQHPTSPQTAGDSYHDGIDSSNNNSGPYEDHGFLNSKDPGSSGEEDDKDNSTTTTTPFGTDDNFHQYAREFNISAEEYPKQEHMIIFCTLKSLPWSVEQLLSVLSWLKQTLLLLTTRQWTPQVETTWCWQHTR